MAKKETQLTKTETKPVKRKRNRPDLANYGQEYVESGANTKFLAHALAVRSLPPIDTSDPVAVENRINEYFVLCAENDIKPSVKGFLNALRVAKSTLWEWKTGGFRSGTHQAIICEAYDVLEALWEDYMMNGKINPVSGIFLGKNNFGYADKQEYVLTPNQQKEIIDPAIIEAKYAELPED
jgi:hypothetical protein